MISSRATKNDKEEEKTSSASQEVNEEKEESETIQFTPRAYIQRYMRVTDELRKRLNQSDESPKSILEVGCSELCMHRYLKTLDKVEKLMYLDIDEQLLRRVKSRVKPLDTEFLQPRETPLSVEVYAGCVTKADERVKKVNPPLFAIVGIEILEHLHEDVEIEFVYTLFARYSPPLIILTTPNSDFNTLIGLKEGEYRHWDHKFELTRKEFKNWCEIVCEHFPMYSFHIEGICEGPKGTEDVGCLSQMAIFELKSDYCASSSSGNTVDLKSSYARFASQLSKSKDDSQQKHQEFTNETESSKMSSSNSTTFENEISIDELLSQIESSESSCVMLHEEKESKSYVLIEKVEYPWKAKSTLQEIFCDEFRDFIVRDTLSEYSLVNFWQNGDTTTLVPFERALEVSQLIPEASNITEKQLRDWLEEDGYQLIGKSGDLKIVIEIPTHEEYIKMCSASEDYEPSGSFLVDDDETWD